MVPARGFGPLLPDPQRIFDLPAGLRYQIISRTGERMDDGLRVPGKPDGMCAFEAPHGMTVLVRNHELDPGQVKLSPYLGGATGGPKRYDPSAIGGTTTLLYDTQARRLLRQHLSLAGPSRNCAGGPTPWHTWITCEETVDQGHGWAFEVPAVPGGVVDSPRPLFGMGRFRREAVGVHQKSGCVYQTEDRSDGLLYRFVPEPRGQRSRGRLQALVIRDMPGLDTGRGDPGLNVWAAVDWVDLDDIASPNDDLRVQGHERGAARFKRGEGIWAANDEVFFACTTGGPAGRGQIWRYRASPHEGTPAERESPARLSLFLQSKSASTLDHADNLTLAPWGDLIACEDGRGHNRLIGITAKGQTYPLGRNAGSTSELAGVTFSPDGMTMFVNIQHDGLTLAIDGPAFTG